MANNRVTYAGEPIVLDLQGQVADFCERWLEVNRFNVFESEPIARVDSRFGGQGGCTAKVGVPLLNYPEEPEVGLNEIWWPQGATRWAKGLVMMDEPALNRVLKKVRKRGQVAANLEIHMDEALLGDQASKTRNVKWPMYLLTPRAITSYRGQGERLFALPLVDQRYYWQWRAWSYWLGSPCNNGATASWSTIFSKIGTALGRSLTVDSAAASWLAADRVELLREWENAAVLLDAVASSLGMRVVATGDGTIQVQSYATAKKILRNNLAKVKDRIIAGGDGDYTPPVPQKVRVSTRAILGGCCDPNGYEWSYIHDNSNDRDAITTSLEIPTIFTTAWAELTTAPQGVPENNAELQGLADNIGAAYINWKRRVFDLSVVGLMNQWSPTGFDDGYIIKLGEEVSQDRAEDDLANHPATGQVTNRKHFRRTTSRVRSYPENFGAHQQLSQGTAAPRCRYYFEIPAGQILFPGSSCQADLVIWNGYNYVRRNPVFRATIHDHDNSKYHGRNFGVPGERFVCRYDPERCRFEVVGSYGLERKGEVIWAPRNPDWLVDDESIISIYAGEWDYAQVGILGQWLTGDSEPALNGVWVWALNLLDNGTQEPAFKGRTCIIRYFPEDGVWRVIWVDEMARIAHVMILQEATGGGNDFDEGDEKVLCREIDYWNGWSPHQQQDEWPSGGVALVNPDEYVVFNPVCDDQAQEPYIFNGELGDCAFAYYDPAVNKYYFIQKTCPAAQ